MTALIALHRKALRNLALRVAGNVKNALASVQPAQQQLRKPPEHMRAEHDIDARIALFDFLRNVFLLHHAAAHADGHIRARLLDVRILSHDAEHALFGMLAHGTGVDDDDVRLRGVLCPRIAHLRQHTRNALGVRLILLTAKGLAEKARRLRAQCVAPVQLLHAVELTRDFLRRYLSRCHICHAVFHPTYRNSFS